MTGHPLAADDATWMGEALAAARAVRASTSPNPWVGCVVVPAGDEPPTKAATQPPGGPHAEIVALEQAGASAAGSTVYVTLEPCNHHGRTPPCVDALLEAGVARVVAACLDRGKRSHGGLTRLEANGVAGESGLMEAEATAANLPWLTAVDRGWPYVVVKAAMTLDGRLATPAGESKWITGEAARREAHRLRAECGAVLVGRTTVEKDNPQLTVRAISVRNQPVRIVLDPWRRIAQGYHAFDSAAPSIRVVAGEPRGDELKVAYRNGYLDLRDLLAGLFERGITSLLVEGGAHTIGSFFDAGLVDRLELFVAGKVFGAGKSWVERPFPGSLASAPGFDINRVRRVGGDLWVTAFPLVRG